MGNKGQINSNNSSLAEFFEKVTTDSFCVRLDLQFNANFIILTKYFIFSRNYPKWKKSNLFELIVKWFQRIKDAILLDYTKFYPKNTELVPQILIWRIVT